MLLTGAGGFIGRPAVDALLRRGAEVHAVGRGRAPSWLAEGVTWARADLLAPGAAAALVDRVAPDHVLHLAWETTPGAYWTSPANADWLRASRELAVSALGHGRRLVTAGTCAEYDWSGDGWCREGVTALAPTTPYGHAKRDLAAGLEELSERLGGSVAHGRIFFVYGPDEAPERLVPSVTRSLLRGQRAPTTHGRQRRDFMHVEDVASALVALLLADRVTGPVNIASGRPVPVRELISTIASEVGRPELVGWGELALGANEPPLVAADVARLRDEVGFAPRRGLADGLREVVDWWRERLAAR